MGSIYIYDEIGFWGVTAKQFVSEVSGHGVTFSFFYKTHTPPRAALGFKPARQAPPPPTSGQAS
ncbi:hypothetical protein [Escherichia coli]|uniref:hypothetical protein n=1 Tax=Escherichia coli TaxID=562 RepID=UPI0039A33B6A